MYSWIFALIFAHPKRMEEALLPCTHICHLWNVSFKESLKIYPATVEPVCFHNGTCFQVKNRFCHGHWKQCLRLSDDAKEDWDKDWQSFRLVREYRVT